MRVSRVPRLAIPMALCIIILCLAVTASAQPGAPVLGTVEDASSGTVRMTWTNEADPPAQFLGFAWDLYAEDWVKGGWNDTMWHNFSSTATTGDMDLGHSGAYFVWISSQATSGTLYPCGNPAVLQELSGPPHKPLEVQAVKTGDDTVRLSWKPEVYGTWLYWILAYSIDDEKWVVTGGPLGESLWHYVQYGDDDFTTGSTNLTVPSQGQYRFLLAGMAWDGQTWGDF